MNYWEERWAADLERALRKADEVIADIDRLHKRAENRIISMIKRIRRRFQMAYGLTEEEAKKLLAAPIGREEYLKTLEEIERLGEKNPMKEKLLAKAAAPAYAYRISVQEGMLVELEAVTAQLAQEEQRILTRHLQETAMEKSRRAGYLIQLEAGVGFKFDGVSAEMARVMLHRPWSGLAFSARIWKNQDALAELLNTVLLEGLTAGNSAESMAQEIAEAMNVSRNRARTLVRTETNYVCNAADAQAYEEAQIERYRYCATLDMRTSKVCRKLDGTVHRLKDAVPGKNYPPMHPNCRSVTRPDISEEELADMERWSRDPVTGENVKVPANMTYAEWLKLQEETYGEERIRAAEKMAANKAADKKQFKEYQGILGKKQLPDTLEKFQIMKYTEPETWADVKYYARNKGERPLWCVKVDRALEKAGINKGKCYPVEQVEIAGWRGHALKRLEERNITLEQAVSFKEKAQGMFKKYPKPQTVHNYFGAGGVIGIRPSDGIVQTVYGEDDFKSDTVKVLEVLKEYGPE